MGVCHDLKPLALSELFVIPRLLHLGYVGRRDLRKGKIVAEDLTFSMGIYVCMYVQLEDLSPTGSMIDRVS